MAQTYKVLLSNQAVESLNKIVDFLAENYSLELALRKEQKILEAIRSLKSIPNAHSRLRIIGQKSKYFYRFLPVQGYKSTLLKKSLKPA